MSNPFDNNNRITKKEFSLSRNSLLEYFANGEKPKTKWKIGVEYETLLFKKDHFERVKYEEVLPLFHDYNNKKVFEGVKEYIENNQLFGLSTEPAGGVFLEPGAQLEMSSMPLASIHDIKEEYEKKFFPTLKEFCKQNNILAIPIGFDPITLLKDIPWIQNDRYKAMREYMQKVGKMGLDMMGRTCTIQTNIDFSTEIDMIKKMRISLSIQPIITTLFANSPVKEKNTTSFKSYRMEVWANTDNSRTYITPIVWDKDFGYEKYVDFILQIPMYGIYRDGKFINYAGKSFLDFLNRSISPHDSSDIYTPTFKDFETHSNMAFPDVRLKQFIEMRGIDSNSPEMLYAISAMWTGLLYDKDNLDELYKITQSFSLDEVFTLKKESNTKGMQAIFKNKSIQEWAIFLLEKAKEGLIRRNKLNNKNENEGVYLEPILALAKKGLSISDVFIQKMDKECIEECLKKMSF